MISLSASSYPKINHGLIPKIANQTVGFRKTRIKPIVKSKAKTKFKMSDSIIGSWAGEHITLDITDHGGTVEYDCAHGSLTQKIILDKRGRFEVLGTHIEEHGGQSV